MRFSVDFFRSAKNIFWGGISRGPYSHISNEFTKEWTQKSSYMSPQLLWYKIRVIPRAGVSLNY